MSEDEFTKLFKYVQRIEQKLDSVAENIAAKKDLNYLQTQLMLSPNNLKRICKKC